MQTANVQALSQYLEGQRLHALYTRDGNGAAIAEFEKAIASDPNFARAHSWLGYARLEEYKQNFSDKDESIALAKKSADEAVRLSPYDHFTHWTQAAICMELKDMPGARREYRIALALADGPNPDMLIEMADMFSFDGKSELAIAQIEMAKKLSPNTPPCYNWSLALAYFQARKYREAADLLEMLGDLANEAYLMFAICKAKLGTPKSPQDINAHMLAKDPRWTNAHLDRMPFASAEDSEHWWEGLRMIGVVK